LDILFVSIYEFVKCCIFRIGSEYKDNSGRFEENGQKIPHLFEENRKEDASFCLKKGFGYTIIRLYV